MKEKIERFARGEFDEKIPKLELPEKPIFWEMDPESVFRGHFKFHSENDIRARGYVICTDGNLKLKTPQFFGKNVKVEFTYHSKNMTAGDRKRGKFLLITNAGEFLVPFEVQIRKNVVEEGELFHE